MFSILASSAKECARKSLRRELDTARYTAKIAADGMGAGYQSQGYRKSAPTFQYQAPILIHPEPSPLASTGVPRCGLSFLSSSSSSSSSPSSSSSALGNDGGPRRFFRASSRRAVVFKSRDWVDIPRTDFFDYILGDISGHEDKPALTVSLYLSLFGLYLSFCLWFVSLISLSSLDFSLVS